MTEIDPNKEQGFEADPKVIQQINVTGNLDNEDRNITMLFIIGEAKETILGFSKGSVTVLLIYFAYNCCLFKINMIMKYQKTINLLEDTQN